MRKREGEEGEGAKRKRWRKIERKRNGGRKRGGIKQPAIGTPNTAMPWPPSVLPLAPSSPSLGDDFAGDRAREFQTTGCRQRASAGICGIAAGLTNCQNNCPCISPSSLQRSKKHTRQDCRPACPWWTMCISPPPPPPPPPVPLTEDVGSWPCFSSPSSFREVPSLTPPACDPGHHSRVLELCRGKTLRIVAAKFWNEKREG